MLDTNVVVSALLFRGRAALLHAAWKRGEFRLVASEDIVGQYLRVLAYPKFRLAPEQVLALFNQEIRTYLDLVPNVSGERVTSDPDDDKFLRVADTAHIATLVSGDPDILDLRPRWRGVTILTVAEAIKRLGEGTPA